MKLLHKLFTPNQHYMILWNVDWLKPLIKRRRCKTLNPWQGKRWKPPIKKLASVPHSHMSSSPHSFTLFLNSGATHHLLFHSFSSQIYKHLKANPPLQLHNQALFGCSQLMGFSKAFLYVNHSKWDTVQVLGRVSLQSYIWVMWDSLN